MPENLSALYAQLGELPTRVQGRCRAQLRQIEKNAARGLSLEKELATFARVSEQGLAWVAARRERLPARSYDENLPIVQARAEIAALISNHQVVVLAGETGSGKTTQLPKICLDIGLGQRGLIAHTQPRRLAATSVARRIADELQVKLGDEVGYAIRFDSKVSDDSLIALMTDGVLLQELRNDPFLSRYDTIIIDEAHERSLNIDLLLGYLKKLLPKRPDLKLIITSATIDPLSFSKFFNDAPVLNVSGRSFPVDVWYRPLDPEAEQQDLPERVHQALQELWSYGPGDVLIFLSGEGEIREVAQYLRKQQLHNKSMHAEVLPLYARLPMSEQQKVFSAGGRTRVVLATNVAETSLTVPGIRYVIDSGYARISRYSQSSRVQRLPIEAIAQASADQRKGRCGRVMAGVCLRLYDEADFLSRPAFATPEILRTSLADLLLQMLSLGLHDIENFPFVDAPDTKRISDGLRLLNELGAINDDRKLTALGSRMSQLPLTPALGRVLLAGESERSLHEMIILLAFMCIRDPRERPQEKADVAVGLHRRFHDPDSDFLAVLNLWKHVHERKEALTNNAWRKELKAEFINVMAVIEWGRLVAQLRGQAHTMNLKFNTLAADYAGIHRALLTGLFHQIGQVTRDGDYLGARGVRFVPHPSSGLARKAKPWVITADLLDSSRLFGLTVAKIEPEWLEQICAPLLKHHYGDPVWREARGDAVCPHQVSLFGLLLAPRSIALSKVNPALARDFFVRHGLLRNEIQLDLAFHKANQAIFRKIEEQEARTRRQDLLLGEDELVALLVARLPASVVDKNSLLKLARSKNNAESESLNRLRLLESEVLAAQDGSKAGDYPADWPLGELVLRLHYRFAPGEAADGVSVRLPLSLLHSLPETCFDALVPGFLNQKIEAILRGLNKDLRKELQPIAQSSAQVAQALQLNALTAKTASFWAALQTALYECKRIKVGVDELRSVALPDNLRMRIEVYDDAQNAATPRSKALRDRADHGRAQANISSTILAAGRDLAALQTQLRGHRQQAISTQTQAWRQSGLLRFPEDALPETVTTAAGVVHLALQDDGASVSVAAFIEAAAAARAHRAGLVRLFALALHTDFRQYQRSHKALTAMLVSATRLPCHASLLDDWHDAAIAEAFSEIPMAQQNIRDAATFAQVLQTLPGAVRQKLAASLPALSELLTLAGPLRARITRELQRLLPDSAQDCELWLDDMFAAQFLQRGGLNQLKSLRRYLEALRLRLEQALANPARESQRLLQWQQMTKTYALPVAGLNPEQAEMARLLREFRVSLFAQTVGTDGPVSEKRLAQQWLLCAPGKSTSTKK